MQECVSCHLKLLFVSFCQLVFSITVYSRPFPTARPCNLEVLKDYMMWWMIYDVVLFAIACGSKMTGETSQQQFAAHSWRYNSWKLLCLWVAFLYVFLLVSGGVVLFKTSNTCTLIHDPHPLLIAVFLNWIYRLGVWMGLLFYGRKELQ